MKKSNDSGSAEVTLILIIGVIFLTVGIMHTLDLFPLHPSFNPVPCDKIMTVTEKYTKVISTDGYIEKRIKLVSGEDIRVFNFYNDRLWDNIPTNEPILLSEMSGERLGDMSPHIEGFTRIKNVTKIEGTSCVNCCSVEEIK